MRSPLIAGNWKMNTTVDEAVELVDQIRKGIGGAFDVEILVCPPFLSLTAVKEALKGSAVKLGAQNLHYEERGAFTGEISPLMLAGLCEYVLVGHSERRQLFGETGETVNKKMSGKAAHGKQVNDTAALLRDVLTELSTEETAGGIRVLYGGSVTAENIAEFLEQSEIDGALAGGASLKSGQFITMVQEAEYIYFPNNLQSKDQMTWWNAHEE
jgi:triosephosphate isomerase